MGVSKYKVYYQGAFSHVYNRGNQKQPIFRENSDFIAYLTRLRSAMEKREVALISYCLMPNHIHLLVYQKSDIPISKLVSSLHTSYSMYFNKKYKTVGHLFQDRFKQKIVDNEQYLLYLSCYIHANPVLDELVAKADLYPWSSYREYVGSQFGTFCDRSFLQDVLKAYYPAQSSADANYHTAFEELLPTLKEKKELKIHLQSLGIS